MKDPTPLIQHIYEMQIEDYLSMMRTGGILIDTDLFRSLYSECTVPFPDNPLHNTFINYYNHRNDDNMKRPRDTSFHFPSRVYHFDNMKKVPTLDDIKEQEAEIPECAMMIFNPVKSVMESLISQCQMISEQQPVTDLFMHRVYCDTMAPREALKLSKSIQSLTLCNCGLPTSFMRDILQQLHDCVTLRWLELRFMDLREVEENLDKLLDNLV